jgi:hypothetical protein
MLTRGFLFAPQGLIGVPMNDAILRRAWQPVNRQQPAFVNLDGYRPNKRTKRGWALLQCLLPPTTGAGIMAEKQTTPRKFKYSTPSLAGTLTLNTEQAKRFGGNIFDNLTTSLFIIDVMARKLAKNNKAFNHKAVATAVTTLIDNMQAEISSEIQRMEHFMKAEKIGSEVTYSNPLVRQFRITSPEIMRVSTLLNDFDRLIVLIDTAWLHGKLDSAEADEFRDRKVKAVGKCLKSLISNGMAAREKAYASSEAADVQKEIAKVEAEVAAEAKVREESEESESADAA